MVKINFSRLFLCIIIVAGGGFGRGEAISEEDLQWPEVVDNLKLTEAERAQVEEMLENDLIGVLEFAREHYVNEVNDYTGVLYKQERLEDKLGKMQVAEFRFREEPFSIFMDWKKNPGPADRLLYVEGERDGEMLAHPKGLLSIINSVKMKPDSKRARESSLQTADQFGFHKSLVRMLAVCRVAKEAGDLTARYVGKEEEHKRMCYVIEGRLPEKEGYNYGRLVLYLDGEHLMPIDIRMYDWQERLIGWYIHTNLRFNVGLGDEDFTEKACGF